MAYPPSVLPTNRANGTTVVDQHPADHNALAQAVNDITSTLGAAPAGSYASVQARLAAQPASIVAWKQGTTSPLTLNANGGAFSPVGIVTATMVAGRLYRYEITARAISAGAYLKLQRDAVDYTGGLGLFDYYIPYPYTSGYTASAASWLIVGSYAGNAGSHTWRVSATGAGAATSQWYDGNGGYAAIYDLGPDPGTQ